MKKIFFLLFTAAGFMACKKSNTDAPVNPGNSVAKIKTWTSGANVSTYNYDAQGRITSSINSNGSGYEYQYSNGTVLEKAFSAGHVLNKTYTLELNTDGNVIRRTDNNNPVLEELYIYNADKTLAKHIGHYAGGNTQVIDYFYKNGNCDSLRFTGNNGNWSLTIQKTYYTDKTNGISSENRGEFFWGKSSSNLLKSEVYKYPDGTTNTPGSYTYEFDANGRVVKITGTQGNNIDIEFITYY